MTRKFRLAQLTDVHLAPLPPLWPSQWRLKRLFGYINFQLKRKEFHDTTRLKQLIEDLHDQAVDHTAVTGDITNLGMPAELERGASWLKTVGAPDAVAAIPGNHDIYVTLQRDPGVSRWAPYMCDHARPAATTPEPFCPRPHDAGFPYVRRFGPDIALIGLNSAREMPLGVPAGLLGRGQIARLKNTLLMLQEEKRARIILIHHPPREQDRIERGRERGLQDADALELVLRDCGAELVLHGHNHRDMISWCETVTGPLPVIGASATTLGKYNIYELSRDETAALVITVTARGFAPGQDTISEISRLRLMPDTAASC